MTRCPKSIPLSAPILFVVMTLLPAPALNAAGADEDYAMYLFKNGHYDDAARQFLFLQYRAGETPRAGYFRYWMARSRLEDGKPGIAERELRALRESAGAHGIGRDEIFFQYLRSLYFQKKFLETAFEAESSALYAGAPRVRELSGWSYINTGEWVRAAGIFTGLAESSGRQDTDTLQRCREISSLLKSRPDFQEKSPLAAGILSALFPGAGHAYAGNWDNAFGAFILNAVFGGLTVYSIYKKEWIYAGFFGFLEAGWYTGNVVSAYQEAQYRNRTLENEFKLKLSAHFPFSLGNVKGDN